MVWRKSTYPGEHNCVELAWRKSTFSAEHDCVEVAWPIGSAAVRDSKNPGLVLVFGRAEFALLSAALKDSGD